MAKICLKATGAVLGELTVDPELLGFSVGVTLMQLLELFQGVFGIRNDVYVSCLLFCESIYYFQTKIDLFLYD